MKKCIFGFLILLITFRLSIYMHPMNYKALQLPQHEIAFQESVTEKGFHEDIALLQYAIQKAYGAKGTIDETTFKQVETALAALQFTSNTKTMGKNIGEILNVFPDNHLQLGCDGDACYKKSRQFTNVGKNRNTSGKNWAGSKTKDNIYTIAISDFAVGKWPGFEVFIQEALQHANAIIIDLRGNPGGSDHNGYLMAEMLAGQSIQTAQLPTLFRLTPEATTIFKNLILKNKINSQSQNEINALNQFLERADILLQQALSGQLEEFSRTEGHLKKKVINEPCNWQYDTSKGFQHPIYILQDKRTGSSGESTIDFFEYFPNVTKVGTHTSGTLSFGDLGLFILPNSGIHVYMPTTANKYKDGRFIEKKGIKPDIQLQEGQDAYEYALKKHRTSRKNNAVSYAREDALTSN